MTITLDVHQVQEGHRRITVAGDIDLSTRDQLFDAITTEVVDPKVTTLHVDLGAVSFLDAAGISALIKGLHLAGEHQTTFQVINAHGLVQRVLTLTDTLDILTGTGPAA